MTHVYADKATMKFVGLIRNKDREPQFDDFNNIPKEFHDILTEEDWKYIASKRKE